MNLDQLKEISLLSAPSEEEQRAIIQRLNQTRFDFGVKELPEIKSPAHCRWFSRSRPLVPPKKEDENRWNYYKQKIQEWITQIELHEASLTRGEKLKRFVGKHKWWLGGAFAVMASIINDVIADRIISLLA
ncbi:hypothetical protein ACLLYI_004791 [Salmonella enterica]